jgi:hypothetical protein
MVISNVPISAKTLLGALLRCAVNCPISDFTDGWSSVRDVMAFHSIISPARAIVAAVVMPAKAGIHAFACETRSKTWMARNSGLPEFRK